MVSVSLDGLSTYMQSERRHGQHQKCSCPDPSIPLLNPDPEWKKHHARLVEDAKRAPKNLDIVFLGDEIIEQWNGTAELGTKVLKGDMREPFQKRFTTEGGGTLEGLALGSSIDTVRYIRQEWHLLPFGGIQSSSRPSKSSLPHPLSFLYLGLFFFADRAPTCFGISRME